MNGFVLLVLMCAHAQTDQNAEPVKTRAVYEITVEGQDEPIYGFVDDEASLDLKARRPELVKIELDRPWIPKKETQVVPKKRVTGIRQLWGREREERLKEEAEAAGYVLVNGAYYRIEEVGWADKAREMAGLTEEETAPAPPAPPQEALSHGLAEPEAAPGTAPSESPSLRPWRTQIALAAVAIVLIGVVVKTMLLNG